MNNNTPTPHSSLKIKFRFWSVIGVLVFVALLLSVVFKILTPIEKKVVINSFAVNNYDTSKSTFKKINYSGPDIIIPEALNIYKSSNDLGLAEELTSRLIADYQLVAHESIENYWLGENYSLAKNSHEHFYTFSSGLKNNGNDELQIISEAAIETCQNFYKKYNILLPLVPQKNDLIYLNSGFEQSVVSAQKATFLQIPLTYELDGYKVFYENQNDYPFFCRVDNFYNLERVVFHDFFQEFSITNKLSSLSLDQAIKNIKNGTASIIDAQSKIVSVIDLNWINEADLYAVEIEYRYDSELKIAYPFFKFSAKLTNSAGINIEAKIITPAVASAEEK